MACNRIGALLILLLLAMPVWAGNWTAESEVRTTDADAQSVMVSLDRSVGERGLAFVSLGETRIAGSETDLDTRRQMLGGLYRFDKEWRLSSYYERWGRRGDIVSDRINLRLSRDYERFGFSISGGSRWITLEAGAPARPPGGGPGGPGGNGGPPITIPVDPGDPNDPDDGGEVAEDYDLRALNLGLSGQYHLDDHWTLRLGYSHYDYDRDPGQLAARDQVERYSASAVTLAQGFLDRSVFIEARYDMGAYREISAYFSRDRSAVDGRSADSLLLSYLQPLTQAWDLRLEVGRTQTEDFDASHSLGVALTWYP